MSPPPGSYDVQKSYDMSQVKHNYMPPRSLVAKIKHSSFLSGTPRCLGKIEDGPGKADYSLGPWGSHSFIPTLHSGGN